VKSTINGVTTNFIGNHYEVSGSTVTKYYFAGTSRIAMRVNSTLSYLLTDHLGSTSITANSNGALVSELRYKPWGETRYSNGTTPTKYTYTGQYSNVSDFGLYFYNARWYDPALGRFAQADSIVPGGVQGWDRYAYTNNNPVRYTDPSGHMGCRPGEKRPGKYYGGNNHHLNPRDDDGGSGGGCNTLNCITGGIGFGGANIFTGSNYGGGGSEVNHNLAILLTPTVPVTPVVPVTPTIPITPPATPPTNGLPKPKNFDYLVIGTEVTLLGAAVTASGIAMIGVSFLEDATFLGLPVGLHTFAVGSLVTAGGLGVTTLGVYIVGRSGYIPGLTVPYPLIR